MATVQQVRMEKAHGSDQRELELDVNVDETFFWTDSTTVLRYINNERTRYHTFVANRLTAIRNASDPKQWRYVESQQNPADDASRGQTIQKFVENDRWVNGPPFLWCSPSEWPQMPEGLQQPLQGDPEVKKAVAWIIKVKQALRQKNKATEVGLTMHDLKQAEGAIFKHVQNRYYHQEIVSLERSKDAGVASTSSVYKLNPILGEDGLLRVGGRLDMSSLSEEERHPIILPKESAVTLRIIRSIHEDVGHLGRNYVIARSRERYWIPQVNKLVRKMINRCTTCRRNHGKTGEQQMADLPAHRVMPDEPPFTRLNIRWKQWGRAHGAQAVTNTHASQTTLSGLVHTQGNIMMAKFPFGEDFLGGKEFGRFLRQARKKPPKLYSVEDVVGEENRRGKVWVKVKWAGRWPGQQHSWVPLQENPEFFLCPSLPQSSGLPVVMQVYPQRC
ncbi:hypothetical protein Bbelb_350540 [Branchiostoma belcheri]|nr:hypothetical protein Bbelb_350540 [Branchiostoma belcheri]